MTISKPIHILRNIKRFNKIMQILGKYGFGFIIDKAHLDKYLHLGPLYRRINRNIFDLSAEVRVRRIFEDLGPTFIKLGQILSTRSDLIPIAFCKELEKLQDKAPVLPFSQIRAILEKELGKPLERIFTSITPEAMGSASLAQIHSARLVTAEEVVVKVLKPGVRDVINADLDILHYIARLVEKYFSDDLIIHPVAIVNELRKSILKETNLQYEAKNIARFARLMVHDKHVYIPRLYNAFCTGEVLVMENLRGVKITDLETMNRNKWNREKIASLLAQTLFRQIFVHRIFHGDPHPGNIMLLKEGRIAFIDFGLLGRLEELSKNILVKMLQAFLNKDTTSLMVFLKKMVSFQNEQDEMDFQVEMEDIIDEYYDITLSEIVLPELLQEVFDILTRYKIKVPSNLFLLMRALLHLESIVRTLDPAFQIVEEVKPFLKSFLTEEYSAFELLRKMKKFALSFYDLLNLLPSRLDNIIEKMERGKLRVQFELLGIEGLIRNLHRIVNRLIYSIISASLIIGSFLVLRSEIGPSLFGYPLFSLIGFFMAFILLLLLFFDIFSSRHLSK